MRPAIVFLATMALGLVGLSVVSCGGADNAGSSATTHVASRAVKTRSARSTNVSAAKVRDSPRGRDSDNDSDNNDDDYNYGRAASAADKQAVTELVKRYYAIAATGDGAKACSLIYSIFAEEIPEVYGEAPGPPELRGSSCAKVMTKLFEQNHRQLVAELPELEVTDVRVRALHALVLLSFKTTPPHDIRVHLEHVVWKIDELLDGPVG